jgi:hypothetical protein
MSLNVYYTNIYKTSAVEINKIIHVLHPNAVSDGYILRSQTYF